MHRLDFGTRNYAAIIEHADEVTVYADIDMDTCQLRAITWAAAALKAQNQPLRSLDGVG